nr:HU family DNA-binding protein [Bacteroides sp.]
MAKIPSFNTRVAEAVGMDVKTVNRLTDMLTGIIKDSLCDGQTIAVPGFGEFTTAKTEERVDTGEDGKRMLLPPAINVIFNPSASLRKRLQ